MKLHDLKPNEGSTKKRKRVGRGISAGGGKTAGRGTKGQGARTGKKLGATFQGGQRTLVRAVPKARGFKSLRTPAQVVYLDHLNAFKGKVVDNMSLFEAGLIDEIGFNIHPVLLGEGLPLFLEMNRQIDLELIESRQFKNGCVYVLYRVKNNP